MFEGAVGCNFGAVGVAVTDQEIFNIENQRNESLRSHGLLELDSRALEMLLTSIGQAPVFPYYYAAETVCELIELYYALRSSYSPEVGDPELIEKKMQLLSNQARAQLISLT